MASGTFNPLLFIAMTPCRIIDTRASQATLGAFGAPSLSGGTSRVFPMQSSAACPIPSAAQAYSLNVTVVPTGGIGFVTAFPTGQPVPLAATVVWGVINIVSNAAIVPAGINGSIDVFANIPTDVVVDINGYYATASDPGGDTALGNGALPIPNGGGNNTAIGSGAMQNTATGGSNTATGSNALHLNTAGYSNTAMGALSLQGNTVGIGNTAVGNAALASNTTGNTNLALGVGSLGASTAGNNNTAVGADSLQFNVIGSGNIAVGYQAGNYNPNAGSNNIDVGSLGGPNDNGVIRLGTLGAQTSFFAAGVSGITTGGNDAIPVLIDSNGQLGTISSSRRYKEDIHDMGDASRGILQLRPVTFRYRKPFDNGSKPIQYGLIAEEVAKVFPDLVARSADGQIETVKYQLLDSLLLNEVQRQEREIRDLKERLAGIELSIGTRSAGSQVP
jgi:hypothetical protein